ncbi:RNA-directed DNA polymerase [uncultured Rubinisphaera sp.]|uniref:RNA-directed DNA polymerase n=2 Tax=Rubinisphaera TaxID=1649490 RepID=UPI0030D8D1EF|tara:strand:+ start:1761 stop:4892 length:3132 start_codon:yes stop_codon:yes gene_type:complete
MAKKRPAKKSAKSSKKRTTVRQSPISDDFVSMDALYLAYRKAKVDVFYERSQPMVLAFCEYERELNDNLRTLQKRLTKSGADWYRDIDFIGSYGFIPKGLQVPADEGDSEAAHFSVSSPDDAWDLLVYSLEDDDNELKAEFRPVALFSVDMYVVCALWVNLVGHMFDACLDQSARGSRLRRLRRQSEDEGALGAFHITAPGSFQPYFHRYKEWREKGLRAIRHELDEGRKVVAITMDLKAFYHNVDPRFILHADFLKAIRFTGMNGRSLTAEELRFSKQVVEAFFTWAKSLPHLGDDDPPGLPVGPSAPRIIANVLLAEFDRSAQQSLDPIYYSRYVDDIFLVLHDNGKFRTSSQVLKHLCRRIKHLDANESYSELKLSLPYAEECRLLFQAKKQRIFLLSGEVGADLLDTIESQIDAVSSEWRLLPDLDSLEKSPAAKVLTANRNSHESVDTLRKADQLSLKRLSFSIMLSHYDTLAHDLPPTEWRKERKRFYRFVERHVLTPLRLMDLNDYLPRMLALAVSCKDWKIAERLTVRISRSLTLLDDAITIEPDTETEQQWEGYVRHLCTALREAVIRAFPLKGVGNSAEASATRLLERIDAMNGCSSGEMPEIGTLSKELFWTDLGRIPFKHALLHYIPLPDCSLHPWSGSLPDGEMERFHVIREFLESVENEGVKIRPLLFPTRPFTPREITEFDSRCAWDLHRLRRYVEALRGTWVKKPENASLTENGNSPPHEKTTVEQVLTIGERKRRRPPRIALTSFLIEDSSWARAAEGGPDLSVERYKRLVRLANAIVTSPHRAEYVVFPELSIPRRWLPGLAGLFMNAGMSLIAGVEYRKKLPESSNEVINEAYLFLTDDRLGYRTWCAVRQQKGVPAHHERDELRSKFGLTMASDTAGSSKPVYRHFGHDFGVLICSELTDIRFRQEMRGNVDTLFVLSWNQDLDSFGSLVESAALDVHCFTVLVNNRRYGDSRVRAPFKKNWMRDQVRVKGGLDDYFVVTDLNILSLRDFQSYHEPPLGHDAVFKPTPEGFDIASRRKRTPGG